jgi:hypothetical protein
MVCLDALTFLIGHLLALRNSKRNCYVAISRMKIDLDQIKEIALMILLSAAIMRNDEFNFMELSSWCMRYHRCREKVIDIRKSQTLHKMNYIEN